MKESNYERINFYLEIFPESDWWYWRQPGGPPLSSPQINCDTVMSKVRLVDVSAVSNWKLTSIQSIVSKNTVKVRNGKGFLYKEFFYLIFFTKNLFNFLP